MKEFPGTPPSAPAPCPTAAGRAAKFSRSPARRPSVHASARRSRAVCRRDSTPRVWPDARQFDLNASGRDELIDRRDKTIRAAANNFGRGVKIIGEDSLKTESNQRNQSEADEKTAFHCRKECLQTAAIGKSRCGESFSSSSRRKSAPISIWKRMSGLTSAATDSIYAAAGSSRLSGAR